MEQSLSDRLRILLTSYAEPCVGDCDHSQCPLLRELHALRIKASLERAREIVKPIVDKERKGEEIGDLMNMRLDTAAPPERTRVAGERTWKCACGWSGTPSQMTVSNTLRTCPQCGASGGLILDATLASDSARRAAEEIREWLGISGLVDGEGLNEVAAIVSKHFAAAPAAQPSHSLANAIARVREMRDRFQQAADSSTLPNDLTASRDTAVANALTRLLSDVESLSPSDVVLVSREEAAKVAENMRPTGGRQWTDEQNACFSALTDCANNIRALGAYGDRKE